jgi:hypothetical protein
VRWKVFEPEGTLLGTVEVPAVAVHQIGPDFVLAVGADELGVERVQLYGLERSARRVR